MADDTIQPSPDPERSDPDAALPPPPATGAGPRRGSRGLLIAGIVVLVLVVAGGAGAFLFLRGAPTAVLDKVPASADVIVVAHLDPSASQKMHLFRMASRFPALGSREELTASVEDMLDEALAGSGLTHEDLAWVGGEAGAFVDLEGGEPTYALLLASQDDRAAASALDRVQDASGTTYTTTSIDGVDVAEPADPGQPTTAIVDSVVVIASDEAVVREVIATANGADGVTDDPTFQDVMGQLPQSNLGFAFANVGHFTELLDALPVAALPTNVDQLAGLQGIGFSVSASEDGLSLDGVTTTDPARLSDEQRGTLAASDGPNELLTMVPQDAYAVFAASGATTGVETSVEQIGQLGPETARMIEQLELLGPDGLLSQLTGDVAVQAGPGEGLLPVSGTVMIGVRDADAVEAWFDRHLGMVLDMADIPDLPFVERAWRTEDYQGTTIHYTNPLVSPVPVAWGVVDGALVIGLSAGSVENAVDLSGGGPNVTTNETFGRVVERLPGTESVVFVDVAAILSAVRGVLPDQAYQAFLDEGGENLEPITVIAAGSESDEHGSRSTLVIVIP